MLFVVPDGRTDFVDPSPMDVVSRLMSASGNMMPLHPSPSPSYQH